MKSILLSMMLFVSLRMAVAQPATGVSASDFKKLKWIEGTWNRSNVKQGKSAHERWQKASDTEWIGLGVSLTGRDTTFVEKLKIVVKDDRIYYVADVPENKEPVLFVFTELSKRGFVCENPDHDFPKKISYTRQGDKLLAQISGDGQAVDFEFVKQ